MLKLNTATAHLYTQMKLKAKAIIGEWVSVSIQPVSIHVNMFLKVLLSIEGVIGPFFHTNSPQTLKVQWASCKNPVFLVLSFHLDSSQLISETNGVSSAVFGIIVSLKCPPSFPLHHPARWHQIFIKNISVQLHEVCWKTALHTAWRSHLQTSLLFWCFWADVPFDLQTWWALRHPNSSIWLSSDQTKSSQYFTGLSKCCSKHAFPSVMKSCLVHAGHGGSAHYFFLLIAGLCEGLHRGSLALWQLLS